MVLSSRYREGTSHMRESLMTYFGEKPENPSCTSDFSNSLAWNIPYAKFPFLGILKLIDRNVDSRARLAGFEPSFISFISYILLGKWWPLCASLFLICKVGLIPLIIHRVVWGSNELTYEYVLLLLPDDFWDGHSCMSKILWWGRHVSGGSSI